MTGLLRIRGQDLQVLSVKGRALAHPWSHCLLFQGPLGVKIDINAFFRGYSVTKVLILFKDPGLCGLLPWSMPCEDTASDFTSNAN